MSMHPQSVEVRAFLLWARTWTISSAKRQATLRAIARRWTRAVADAGFLVVEVQHPIGSAPRLLLDMDYEDGTVRLAKNEDGEQEWVEAKDIGFLQCREIEEELPGGPPAAP